MKTKLLQLLALVLLSGGVHAGTTRIAQLPLLNITGAGTVKPNLMLLYDNSGSMASTFTPDYIDDTPSCRKKAQMSSGGTRGCAVGYPPFNSADFNRQYYNPKVMYSPPVYWNGTSYPAMNSVNTTVWSAVPTDGFGNYNASNMLGVAASSTNLLTGFPDIKWCDGSGNCVTNTATYRYPDDVYTNPINFNANPYYYTIRVAEFCADANLTNCKTTTAGATAPADYPYPAKLRWCDSTSLANCQAKYVGNFKYPRFSTPSDGQVAAYGTITVGTSATAGALTIDSVTVGEPSGPVVITNGAVAAAGGTNIGSKQQTVATALAASIVAKAGLGNQYTACVRTPSPSSAAPSCSTYGITLDSTNVVAVIPIVCNAGTTGKSMSNCAVLTDGSRSGWPITVSAPSTQVSPAQPSTATITFGSGTTAKNKTVTLDSLKLGSRELLTTPFAQAGSKMTGSEIVNALFTKIGTKFTTITAYIGGNQVSDVCRALQSNSLCLVDTASSAAAGGVAVSVGNWTNLGTLPPPTATNSSAYRAASTDSIPFDSPPPIVLGTGSAVFVRTDIVATRTSYPKDPNRSDCAATTSCSYDEEMTNFANWYGYYKTRNQMMKTAVGQAFRPITDSYKVGLVSLSVAAVEGTMMPPKPFSAKDRENWYAALYKMDGDQSTPLRPALHAVGKMYSNVAPYVAAAGSEVVQFPCQQNFTFVTTDGYWNGAAAADVVNNDNVEDPAHFCSRASGCLDPSVQSANSLADVALYWYNGGPNKSLRTTLENWTKPGLVPAASGDNTRLHMNTYALGLGVDGVMTYEPNYDTAAQVGGDFYRLITGVTSGCPWNANGAYVWPNPLTGDSSGSTAYQSRVDDLWHAAINGHGKYFSASDPKQVVEGLRSALSNIEIKIGAAAAAATSTPNISQQDNDIFSDTFTTVKWYGELSDKKIDTVTGVVNSTPVWNSSDQVGRKVAAAADTRTLKMLDTATGALKDFKYSAMTALEQGWFSNKCSLLAQCNALSILNRAVVDSGANMVDWLRGQQQYANDNVMRAYALTGHNPPGLAAPIPIVLGDIASSKPAFLREPRKGYSLAGYSQYKLDQKDRAATVFAAANDGMLHAFSAASGEELWGYAPRITMSKLYLQASTGYGTSHQFSTDGSPEVADVQIGSPLAWKSVLVAGLNGGGRGYYALDVTDPANPVALWELCADITVCTGLNNDPDLGLSFGNPQFGTFDGKWVVFLTSGYNNVPGTDGVATGDGNGYLYIVDVSNGHIIKKVATGSGGVGTPSGFAKITSISSNPNTDPATTYVYGGDNQGQMWRFDLTAAPAVTRTLMANAGALQPITTRPDVTACAVSTTAADGSVSASSKPVVVFGTGRLLDVPDVSNTDTQSLYVIRDSASEVVPWRDAASMVRQTLSKIGTGTNANSYAITAAAVDLSTKSGWYVDFDQNAGERINLDPKVVSGGVNVVTNLPSSSSDCSVGGTSNVYQLNVCTGNYIAANTVAGTTLSNTSAAVGFIIIRLPSGALKMVTTTADGNTITSGVTPAVTLGTRKSGWRRVKN